MVDRAQFHPQAASQILLMVPFLFWSIKWDTGGYFASTFDLQCCMAKMLQRQRSNVLAQHLFWPLVLCVAVLSTFWCAQIQSITVKSPGFTTDGNF